MDIIWLIIAIPFIIGLSVIEYLLLRISNKLGLIIPVLSVISIIPLGTVGIVLTVIIFIIYFFQGYIIDRKKKRQREVDKMRIEDL